MNHFWCHFKKIHCLRRYKLDHSQVFVDHSGPATGQTLQMRTGQNRTGEGPKNISVDKWFPVIFPTTGSASCNFIIKLMDLSGVTPPLMILIITPSTVISRQTARRLPCSDGDQTSDIRHTYGCLDMWCQHVNTARMLWQTNYTHLTQNIEFSLTLCCRATGI